MGAVVSAADFLARLERVTDCKGGRWRSICPAHPSKHKTQSLSVRELPDGTLLVKCFAGCDIGAITAAVGLTIRDLFPVDHSAPRYEARHAAKPNHWHAMREAVQTLKHECLLVAIAASDIARGETLSTSEAARVLLAAERIRAAIEACST